MRRYIWQVLVGLGVVGSLWWVAPRASAIVITIDGTIRYTGATGNEGDDAMNATDFFPARGVKVEVWDSNNGMDVMLAFTWTDDDGKYSVMVDNVDTEGIGALTIDPYIRVKPETPPNLPFVGGVKSRHLVRGVSGVAMGDDVPGDPYVFMGTPINNVLLPPTINHDFGTAGATDFSFSAFDALQEASRYYSTLPGTANNSVETLFPTMEGTSNFSNSRMHVLQGDRYDWDVIGHEYGHFVQSLHPGIDNSPGGGHSSRNNLRISRAMGGDDGGPVLDAIAADQLAWSEGWATYFAISGQQEMNTAALGIQRAGDTLYHDNDDTDGTSLGLRYDIEDQTVGGRPSRGQDNEAAVARILYDLYDDTNEIGDRDRVSLGDHAIWNIIRNNSTDTLDKFWDALIAQPGIDNGDRIDYGAIFQAHNVSPQPDETSVFGQDFALAGADPAPEFRWAIPQGGQVSAGFTTDLLDNFGLKFFDFDLNEILDTGLLGNVTSYTPNAFDWALLTAEIDFVQWIVYGQQTTMIPPAGGVGPPFAYTTGNYWSDSLFFTVGVTIPEPTTYVLLLVTAGSLLTYKRSRQPGPHPEDPAHRC